VGVPDVPVLTTVKPAARSSRRWISADFSSSSDNSGVAQTSREMRRMASRTASTAADAVAAEAGGGSFAATAAPAPARLAAPLAAATIVGVPATASDALRKSRRPTPVLRCFIDVPRIGAPDGPVASS
jgi:hypothetical protein